MGEVVILPDRRIFKRMNKQFTASAYVKCAIESAKEYGIKNTIAQLRRDRARGTIDGWLLNITMDAIEAAWMDDEIDELDSFEW